MNNKNDPDPDGEQPMIEELQDALMDKAFMANMFLCFAAVFLGFGLYFYFMAAQFVLAGYCMFGTTLSTLGTGLNWLLLGMEKPKGTQTAKQGPQAPKGS